jgi:Tfp pilus assembly protein PilF
LAFLYKGDHQRALADYDRAIAIDPQYASAYNDRAYVRLALGDIAGALEDARLGASLDPSSAYNQDTYGDMLCRNDRIDEAMTQWARSRAASGDMALMKQQLLKEQGYYHGSIDGEFGQGSIAALRAWAGAGCPGL